MFVIRRNCPEHARRLRPSTPCEPWLRPGCPYPTSSRRTSAEQAVRLPINYDRSYIPGKGRICLSSASKSNILVVNGMQALLHSRCIFGKGGSASWREHYYRFTSMIDFSSVIAATPNAKREL